MDVTEAQAILQAAEVFSGLCFRWSPEPPDPGSKHERFLLLDSLESLFGGAAGGGKSTTLLNGALQYVDVPGYSALVLRRTYQDLAKPGAIMDRAKQWLRPYAPSVHWDEKNKTFTFPSSARITFGYLQHEDDKYQYQSSEFQTVCVDELTQFTETQYTYLLSRLRRKAGVVVPLRALNATNPGGRGHDWVKRRFVDDETRGKRSFIPALLEDNRHIDQASYALSLAGLDATTRMQLRRGLWVRDTQGLVYKYNADINAIPCMPDTYPRDRFEAYETGWRHLFVVDFGTREDKPTTAIAVLAYRKHDDQRLYVVESSKYSDFDVSDVAEQHNKLSEHYQFERRLGDQGGLGRGYLKELQRRHRIPFRPVEKADKLGFRKLLNDDLRGGKVMVVEHSNAELIAEWNELVWNDRGDDNEKGQDNHASDAVLYGWRDARHYMSRDTPYVPKEGTQEHARAQAQKMRASKIRAVKEKQRKAKKQPWRQGYGR